jgi:bifunctional non-homologous end joining protein LigD
MAVAQKTPVTIDGRALTFTNLEKVLFPHDGITKGDLIAYYRAMAPVMLPYLRGRPLTVERFPDGIAGETWWEKDKPRGLPAWVRTQEVVSSNERGKLEFVVVDDEATLAYVANLAAIVLHVWYSHAPTLETPDFLFIDLDPYECTLAMLARVALRFRDELASIGLGVLVKTSGGSGLHLIVPLEPRYDYDAVKVFSELLARRVNGLMPSETTLVRALARRPRGTVYLDYLQVAMGKTSVAPFSVRARDGAPVSMPLRWPEVEALGRSRARETSAAFGRWTMKNVPRLIAKDGDPWVAEGLRPQRLEAALKKARSLWE